MTTAYHKILECVSQQPTQIPGLKWFPNLAPTVSNDEDFPPFGFPNSAEVSDCNLIVLKNAIDKLGNKLNCVVEIGVDRNGSRSFTSMLLKARPPNSIYLGIDVDDKSHVHQPEKNQFFLRTNSHNQQTVRDYLSSIGAQKIDLLLIDGWHSVNTAVNDWSYNDLVSDHGLIVLHDTNAHPGPVALFDAVDETQWRKTRYCTQDDMGISLFVRTHGN